MSTQMIAPDVAGDAAPLLRREFSLDSGHGPVREARLSLSALGLVEAWLNGQPVSDELLTPGWTSYEWRVRVVEHDVTTLVADRVVIGLALGNGWYRGRLGFTGQRALYGSERAGWAELRVEFADGHVQTIGTDESWQASSGATLTDDLYDGQTVDARLRDERWLHPGFDSSGWGGVHAVDLGATRLVSRTSPPVRRLADRAVEHAWTSPAGATLLDFGQNLVGFLRLRVQGPAGTVVVVRHAEVLEHDELGVRPLRTAAATDRFILSGDADVFEPTFTFHGFRYAEISGWPGTFDPAAVTAVVVGTELESLGTFSCSDPLLNQLHSNVDWGMRGNFLSVPSDCPQRDERLRWTGDLSVFAPTAAYLADVETFLADWLVDLALEQDANGGAVPVVVPNLMKYLDTGFPEPGPTAVWGDAAVWVPWALWQAYGDERVLRAAYPSMVGHVRSVAALLTAEGVWAGGFQFGDWLDPDAPADDPGAAKADNDVVATACAYRSASMLAETAAILGADPDAAECAELRDRIRAGFTAQYVGNDGRIRSDCATVYALAIVFDLLDGPRRTAAGARLAELVAADGYRITTGFAGTPYVCDALADTGHLDAAYRLLLHRGLPSWLYPVTMGATTVWERWDSMLPNGSINPGEMTSFNHYALGSVADWMHRTIGGLAPLEPGYRTILMAPRPGGGLTQARAALRTPHGLASVDWRIADGRLTVTAVVPPTATAVVRLPGAPDAFVGAGTHEFTVPAPGVRGRDDDENPVAGPVTRAP